MNSRLNRIYHTMISRCYNPKSSAYYKYGAKGIVVCEEWLNNEIVKGVRPVSKGWFNFKEWALSNGYNDTLTIDRIDNSRGYSPDNCRWVSYKKQNNNKVCNLLITFCGETRTLAEWCEIKHLDYITTYYRIYKYHWEIEKAFSTKVRAMKKHTIQDVEIGGIKKNLRAWCEELGLSYLKVWKRIYLYNWDIKRALELNEKRDLLKE